MNIIQHMDIPQNIYEFISSHNGCNLSININSTDAINGYGHIMWYSVHISMLTRTCNRCGYDPLWRPNDEQSKCIRHTYDNWRYDDVFVWKTMMGGYMDTQKLEGDFDTWLKAQPTQHSQPAKRMFFQRR